LRRGYALGRSLRARERRRADEHGEKNNTQTPDHAPLFEQRQASAR
jgi:hypothetical protein